MGNTSEELTLKIGGDSAGGQAAVNDLVSTFSSALQKIQTHSFETQKAATELHGAFMNAFTHPTEAVHQLAEAIQSSLAGSLTSVSAIATGVAGGLLILGAGLYEVTKHAYELAARAADAGERLNDMAAKSGQSVPALSRLSFALQVAGGDVETAANAMFMFERRMSTSPNVVEAGLQKIGLSLADIRAMAPDQQFLVLSQAIAAVEDPSARAGAAMDLMGRQGREMVPMMVKLADAMDLTSRITPFTAAEAKEAEAFAMQVRALELEFQQMAIALGKDLLPAARFFVDWVRDTKDELTLDFYLAFGGFVKQWQLLGAAVTVITGQHVDLPGKTGIDEATRKLKDLKDAAFDAAHSPDALVAAWKNAPLALATESIDAVVMSLADEKTATRDLDDEVRKSIEAHKKLAEALNEYRSAGTDYLDLITKIGNETYEGIAYDHERGISVETLARMYGVTKTEIEQVIKFEAQAKKELEEHVRSINESHREEAAGAAAVAKSLGGGQEVLKNLSIQLGDTQLAGKQFNEQVLGPMPDLSLRAAYHMRELIDTIGDKLKGALKSSLVDMNQMFEQAFTGGGGVAGAATAIATNFTAGLLSAIPIVGPVVSQFAGAIISGFKALFGGPSQQELQGRGVEADFQKQFGSFANMMTAVGAAYAATGRSAQQAQADVQALMNAEKQGGDAAKAAIDKINAAFNDQKQDAADLDTAITKYGFSIEELGPAMQKQKLDQQAQQLINDWRLLVASGIDVVTVDEHMAKSMNDYLATARKTGQEVPIAMQPILQKMIDQGALTDENGNKITDMKDLGVTFSETMTQGFQKVVDKLDQLLQKIGIALPDAISKVPKSIDVGVDLNAHWNIPDMPKQGDDASHAAAGGFVTSRGIVEYFGGGGFVPRGTDTVPAMLTPGEAVLNRAAAAMLGPDVIRSLNRGRLDVSSIGASGGGDITIHVDAKGAWFGDSAHINEVATRVGDAVAAKYRLNRQLRLRTR